MKSRNVYYFSGAALVISFVCPLIFLLFTTADLFARSGAVMVLLSVTAEYALSQFQTRKLAENIETKGVESLDVPQPFSTMRLTAHVFVIIGTAIWAYGDIFAEYYLTMPIFQG